MPTVTVVYNLPEEQPEYEEFNNRHKYSLALDNIRQELRSYWKWDNLPENLKTRGDIIEYIYQRCCTIISEEGIEL